MEKDRSREALNSFLNYLSAKGLMAVATVNARKAASSKILSILDENEASDVTSIDLEDIVSRFSRLHGKDYTPQSLVTYKSRLRSSIDDFASYLQNPLAFRPSIQNREKRSPGLNKGGEAKSTVGNISGQPTPSKNSVTQVQTENIIPIAIRADLTVFVQGLPFDLSESEARKIAAVITAMAQP